MKIPHLNSYPSARGAPWRVMFFHVLDGARRVVAPGVVLPRVGAARSARFGGGAVRGGGCGGHGRGVLRQVRLRGGVRGAAGITAVS